MIVIAINVIMSFMAFQNASLSDRWILHPYDMSRNNTWYRLITSGFIHGDMFHLLFNMISFYSFAVGVARLEWTMGSLTFGAFYIASLVISDLTTVVRHKDNYGYRALGASGAVSAVILASVLEDPSMQLMFMFAPFPIPGWLFALLYIGYSYYASTRKVAGNIGHEAHLWGAIAGIFLGYSMSPTIRHHFLLWLQSHGIG
jgi:membrane associated rhomboid family serine protease